MPPPPESPSGLDQNPPDAASHPIQPSHPQRGNGRLRDLASDNISRRLPRSWGPRTALQARGNKGVAIARPARYHARPARKVTAPGPSVARPARQSGMRGDLWEFSGFSCAFRCGLQRPPVHKSLI